MDIEKILEQYKNAKTEQVKMILADGGLVVGTHVDENNLLHYIVKRDNNYSVEQASGLEPTIVYFPKDSETRTHHS